MIVCSQIVLLILFVQRYAVLVIRDTIPSDVHDDCLHFDNNKHGSNTIRIGIIVTSSYDDKNDDDDDDDENVTKIDSSNNIDNGEGVANGILFQR